MPDERYRSVLMAKKFMEELCRSDLTPRVPKSIRERAYSILRHYPTEWDMKVAAEGAPGHFQEKMEPVTRLMAKYEENKKNDNN